MKNKKIKFFFLYSYLILFFVNNLFSMKMSLEIEDENSDYQRSQEQCDQMLFNAIFTPRSGTGLGQNYLNNNYKRDGMGYRPKKNKEQKPEKKNSYEEMRSNLDKRYDKEYQDHLDDVGNALICIGGVMAVVIASVAFYFLYRSRK